MKGAIAAMLLTAFVGTAGGLYVASRLTAPAPRPASTTSTTSRAQAVEALFTTPLTDLNGDSSSLARWRDGVLVVNFWATWCPPCREEMPDLSRLQARHAGARFVGIAVDAPEKVAAFAANSPVAYPLLFHPGDAIGLSRDLGNASLALPFTLVVAKGTLHWSKVGRVDANELDALLAKLGV